MFNIKFYTNQDKELWDDFILNKSENGTFIQTRKFIEYHEVGKFKDCSVLIYKGNELVATILACDIIEEGKRCFFAHKGTTFGGISISKNIYNTVQIEILFNELELFIKLNGFESIFIRMVPNLYSKSNTDMLDYFFYKNNYYVYNELNYYLDLTKYKENIENQFTADKRRDYRYSLKAGFRFTEITSKDEIADFYKILSENLKKYDTKPVHTLDELYDLKFNRFNERIKFYGVFNENEMIAGSMVFLFDNNVFHTQYLCSKNEYQKFYPMNFLYYKLIEEALILDNKILSFGICTEDRGKYLNQGLSRFKEGFGTEYINNYSYKK